MVLLQDLCELFYNLSLFLKISFSKFGQKPNLCRDFKSVHSSMVCIGVYHDNFAKPAIETIPPVSAQLW